MCGEVAFKFGYQGGTGCVYLEPARVGTNQCKVSFPLPFKDICCNERPWEIRHIMKVKGLFCLVWFESIAGRTLRNTVFNILVNGGPEHGFPGSVRCRLQTGVTLMHLLHIIVL